MHSKTARNKAVHLLNRAKSGDGKNLTHAAVDVTAMLAECTSIEQRSRRPGGSALRSWD